MDWIDVIPFFESEKFRQIISFLAEERKKGKNVFPPNKDILRAFELTQFDNVKVVIFGQDPYHQSQPQYACGLAFSVRQGTTPLPKSLVNILTELNNDIGTNRTNGDLSDWAEQGVLLLNTSLTVSEGAAGSHSNIGWKSLIRDVIHAINEYKENVVFILWGKHAQSLEMFIDTNKHHVIKSSHPSPLSAHRGFFGSRPFSKTNKYLEEHGKDPIKW